MSELIDASTKNIKMRAAENVIQLFFDRYPAPVIEEKLWDFCMAKMTLAEPFNYGSPTDDLLFYEDLLQLLQQLKYMDGKSCWPRLVAPSFSEQTLVSVEGVVNLIKQAIPVGTIYNLSKNKEELDLIVVLEKNCTQAYNEYDDIINLSILGYQNGTCTLHNYGLLNTLINKGHFFYATACIEENVVYRKSTAELFPQVSFSEEIKMETENRFKNGMQKATNFFSGAQHYFANGQYEMATFMLQQTTELAYRCLLNVLRGKDLKCHSPAALRKHLKRFAPEIIGIFSPDEETELMHLQVLEDAYVKSRYQVDYQIDREVVAFLNDRVGQLQKQTFQLFKQRMEILKGLMAANVNSNEKDYYQSTQRPLNYVKEYPLYAWRCWR